MRRVCAWCRADLGPVESNIHPEDTVTHGICPSCAARLSSLSVNRPEPLHQFLDSLGVPVLLVESEPRVLTGNKLARQMLGKELDEIEGRRGGEVIRCTHADTPGGCGKDVHCKSCTIRNTVLETFATGKDFLHVQAYPDIQLDGDVKTMSLEISTEKVADVVLLRIDDFGDPPEQEATD
ncbi:MAG: hypothetical protein QGG42_08200 [Phycisphaerae bacterium]|jgi:PAS domain-containing protein|nr:hypothetical protein [Phycisphaerae bacterium]